MGLKLYGAAMIFLATLLLIVVLRMYYGGRDINLLVAIIPICLGYLAGFCALYMEKINRQS